MNEPLYYGNITRQEYLDGEKNAHILATKFGKTLPAWRDDAGLVSAANLAFVRAAQHFDRGMGWRWLTYLYTAVYRALHREWTEQRNLQRLASPNARIPKDTPIEPLLSLEQFLLPESGEEQDFTLSHERPVEDYVVNKIHLERCLATLTDLQRLRIYELLDEVPMSECAEITTRQNTSYQRAFAIHKLRPAYFGPVAEIPLRCG
jgi:hypothetical protein